MLNLFINCYSKRQYNIINELMPDDEGVQLLMLFQH